MEDLSAKKSNIVLDEPENLSQEVVKKSTQRNVQKQCKICRRDVWGDRMREHQKSRNCKPELKTISMTKDVYKYFKQLIEHS